MKKKRNGVWSFYWISWRKMLMFMKLLGVLLFSVIILIGASLYGIAYKIAQLYFSVRTGKEYMCQVVHDKRFTSSLQRHSFTSSIGTSCPSSFCKEVTPLSMNPQGLI